jgi:hypothetical protein
MTAKVGRSVTMRGRIVVVVVAGRVFDTIFAPPSIARRSWAVTLQLHSYKVTRVCKGFCCSRSAHDFKFCPA